MKNATASDIAKIAAKFPVSKAVARLSLAGQGEMTAKDWEGCVAEKCFVKGAPQEAIIGKRIRQGQKPLLNKLEAAWFEALKRTNPSARPQAMKFRLGNGIAYKPDFVDLTVRPVTCWEVKGPHAFRGGFENLKVAASLYQDVRWILVWRESGRWQQQEVLP